MTALSLSGMGRSDHRTRYSMSLFAEEARTAAVETGLFAGAVKPVIVGHSAGAGPAATLADTIGVDLHGVVILDSGIRPADMMSPQPPPRTQSRVYATIDEALAAYRFAPPQPASELYIIDWIARHAITPVATGWTWRFDPKIFAQVRASEAWHHLVAARCPLALVNGDRSLLIPAERVAFVRSHLRANVPFVTIPQAAHHLMVDQPLAVVAALRALLEGWGHRSAG